MPNMDYLIAAYLIFTLAFVVWANNLLTTIAIVALDSPMLAYLFYKMKKRWDNAKKEA